MARRCSTRLEPVQPEGGRKARLSPRVTLATLFALVVVGGARAAEASSVVIDATTPGTVYDAILDGFPGLAPLDGTADFAGNALAVGRKAGVTEERGIAEFPLAPLAGVAASDVTSAKLTFNIDDVLSTFGPGTDFDGTASDPIYVAVYSGNGAVGLDDFNRGTRVATVPTGGSAITDVTLGQSGPIRFEIDLTEPLRDLIEGDASHFGVVFSTDDTPTGISLDDLGVGGGPPGARGARLPFLTIEVEKASPTPTPTPAATPSPSVSPAGATPSPGATSGPTPSPKPTAGPLTPTPGATPTPGPTATPGPSSTPAGSSTPGATSTPVISSTPTGSSTPAASSTPQPTQTGTSSPTPSATQSVTVTPSRTPRATPTRTPSRSPSPTPSSGVVPPQAFASAPDSTGDQLVFYYDARSSFTTFLSLHNLSAAELAIRLVFLAPDLSQPFEDERIIPANGTTTIDLEELVGAGLPGRYGIALATAVDESGVPVVSRALEGSFTVANSMTGSAWGAPAPARRAIELIAGQVAVPPVGAPIDGRRILLKDIRPEVLSLAVYYDPAMLSPATSAGNQLILISFDDLDDDDALGASPEETTWEMEMRRKDGSTIDVTPLSVAGVGVVDLESIAGAQVNGASGSIRFSARPSSANNRLVFFTESLGSFSAGYLLPHRTPAPASAQSKAFEERRDGERE